MFVGSPETVANRIAAVVRSLRLSRFGLAYAVGGVPMRSGCRLSSCTAARSSRACASCSTTVDAGPLERGGALQPDGSPFAVTYSAAELRDLIGRRVVSP